MSRFSLHSSSKNETSGGKHSLEQEADSSWGRAIDEQPTEDSFLARLLEMYWEGVYREVKHILINLTAIADIEEMEVEKDYRNSGTIAGYDAFVDQVCEKPQVPKRSETRQSREGESQQPLHPLREKAPENGQWLREAVAKELEATQLDVESLLHFRARCLLQSAGFLDIDKLVEYCTPVERFSLWKRGKVPQLKLDRFKESGSPVFVPARCTIPSCREMLRGTFFRCVRAECPENPRPEDGEYICEDCFRAGRHPRHHLVKVHKHCILDEVIDQHVSQKLCKCSEVSRFDADGNYAKLYPVNPALKHRQATGGAPKCRLFLLPGLVAEAKHRELVASLESRKEKLKGFQRRMKSQYAPVSEPVFAIGAGLVENLDSDVALPLRSGVSNFPFGNTHVAIMIGPLIIENGYTKKGVLISQRDPLKYFDTPDVDDRLSYCIALSDDLKVFGKHQKHRQERRLKACMKQVVGGAFSKFFNHELEDQIVSNLIAHSRSEQKSIFSDVSRIHKGTRAVTEKLKRLLGSRIRWYLRKIIARLFDPNVPLEWDAIENNCQAFSDSILTYRDFGALFGNNFGSSAEPTYLLSFVVRKESYDRTRIVTKFDVPNGLTEEYILSFRSGRHDDSDILDTLNEYWYDWGAFGGPPYKYQDHFPWDCTEAYKPELPTCNDCTLARHVWAFPFDSWSVILLSLYKDRLWYPAKSGSKDMTKRQWVENRFRLFIAQDALCRGAVAMAHTPLRGASSWFGASMEPQFDRLKLGGIHRAQPYSHHFEHGQSIQIYVAEWIHLIPEERVRRYEVMRNERKTRPDVLHYRSKPGLKIPQRSSIAGVWTAQMNNVSLQVTPFADPSTVLVHHHVSQGIGIVPSPDLTGIHTGAHTLFDLSGVTQFGVFGDGGASNMGGGGL